MSDIATVKRVDASANLPTLTSNASHVNHVALLANDGSGNIAFRRWNGSAWVAVSVGATSLGTLAGDVTGAPGANVVEDITGVAGVVSMHGTVIRSDAGLDLEIASGTGSPPGEFSLRRGAASAFLAATGSGGGELVNVRGGATILLDGDEVIVRTGAGSQNAIWTVSGIAFSQSLGSVGITHATDTGTGATMSVIAQSSSNAVGGNLFLGSGGGGGGNLPGNVTVSLGVSLPAVTFVASSPQPIVHFHGNTVRWSETSTPFLGQEQRSTDAATHDLIIQSQAPDSAAVTNRLAGNIIYNTPPPSDGTDPHSHHVFRVSDEDVVQIDRGEVSVTAGIQFMDAFVVGGNPTIYAERAAADQDGVALIIEGQRGGVGTETDNGDIVMSAGPATGTGLPGGILLYAGDLSTSIQIVAKDATHTACVLAGGAGFTSANLPTNVTNFVYIGDSAGVPSTAPTGGSVLMSVSGYPYLLTKDITNLHFVLSDAGTTPGTLRGYMRVNWNDLPGLIPVYNP